MFTEIRASIADGLKKETGVEVNPQTIELTIPDKPEFGDLTCNIALIKSNAAGMKPREIAENLTSYIDEINEVEKVEVAGPGFLNIYMTDEFMHGVVQFVFVEGKDYGGSIEGEGQFYNLEFISANPTGPLNAVSARAAAYGDSMARILRFCGYDIKTEFYICDAGTQVTLFGESVLARVNEALGLEGTEIPENGYQGEYIKDIANVLIEAFGDGIEKMSLKELTEKAIELIVEAHKATLDDFHVDIDNWFSQTSLYPEGIEAARTRVAAEGNSYSEDDAVWAKTAEFGDDENRVLVRSNGEPTYFLADLAYHLDKKERGFDKAIVVLGPDHHGHHKKMDAGMAILGIPKDWLEIIISQQVNLLSGGEKQKMSKRSGNLVEMREVINEIGCDVARYFFLMRGYSSHLDFDVELAKSESLENPVFYVQYCHARACSLGREGAERMGWDTGNLGADLLHLSSPQERLIERKLWEFPMVVSYAAVEREPHHICSYLADLAAQYHRWYQGHRVLDPENEDVGKARLELARATAQVIRNGLALLGIEAVESM